MGCLALLWLNHTSTQGHFSHLSNYFFKGWMTQRNWDRSYRARGGLIWTGRGRGGCRSALWSEARMVWSVLRGLTSWPRWLTFGARVTHPCLILDPETITVSRCAPATDAPSLPVVQQCTDDTLSCPVPSSESHLLFSGGIISIHQPTRCVGKQYKWECWQMALQLLYICKVAESGVDQQSALCDKLRRAPLCSLSLSEVIKSHFGVTCEWARPDPSNIFQSPTMSFSFCSV